MMIWNPFLTINKAKWSYSGIFHIFLIEEYRRKIYEILYWFALLFTRKRLSNNFPGLFERYPHHKESLYFVYKWIPKVLLEITY